VRRILPLLLVVALAGVLAPAADAAPIAPPLATRGAQIVDARGRPVVLQGVNWFGFETANLAPHGLWTRDYRAMLDQVRALGFNTIRLPFSLAMLRSTTVSGIDVSGGRNAPLRGLAPLAVMDRIIAAAGRRGLLVLLDAHSVADDAYQQPLWYGDGSTEADWVAAWRMLARRYRGTPNVIGADLKNEPHGPATWGTGGPTDWRRAAERAGNAVLGIAPHWLVVVEGIEGRVAGQRLATHWWGGNLEGVRRAPVRLRVAHRLVYSPHEYGPGVFPQPWFARPDMAALLERRWQTGFGYIAEQGIAPVLVGEFGGREVGTDTIEGRWQRQFLDYLGRTGTSWTYWALNPDSGDTGGILRDDWRTVDAPKMALLRRLIARRGAAGGPARATRPAPVRRDPAGATPPPPERLGPPRPPGLATPAPARSPYRVDARWPTGWCAHLDLPGPRRPRVAVALPPGARITQLWNATAAGATGRVTLALPTWATAPYTATGFCVTTA
jgi:endoglucanase